MENIESNRLGFRRFLNLICMTPLGFLGLVLLGLFPFLPYLNQGYLIRWFIWATIVASASMAFDFSGGYISIVNFGFSAFIGVGAYSSALIALLLGIPPWLSMFLGILPAALLGFLVGAVSLRLRGMFAICFTWFVGLAFFGLAMKLVPLTRGPLGLRAPYLFKTSSNLPYFYVAFGMLVVTYIVLKWILRSHLGLAFQAIGQNVEAAMTSGIYPAWYRIINFTVSCGFAGWLGGFYAHYYGILTPDLMHTSKTVEILVIAYVGGRKSLWGGVLVAFPFVYAMEMVRSSLANLPGLNLIIYGLFLILIMIYYPGGLAESYQVYLGQSRNPLVRWLINK